MIQESYEDSRHGLEFEDWILAQASTLGVFFYGTLQALESHQLSVLEEDEAFQGFKWDDYPPGSSPVLCHSSVCGLDVWLSSTVYLNLGLSLFYSYF